MPLYRCIPQRMLLLTFCAAVTIRGEAAEPCIPCAEQQIQSPTLDPARLRLQEVPTPIWEPSPQDPTSTPTIARPPLHAPPSAPAPSQFGFACAHCAWGGYPTFNLHSFVAFDIPDLTQQHAHASLYKSVADFAAAFTEFFTRIMHGRYGATLFVRWDQRNALEDLRPREFRPIRLSELSPYQDPRIRDWLKIMDGLDTAEAARIGAELQRVFPDTVLLHTDDMGLTQVIAPPADSIGYITDQTKTDLQEGLARYQIRLMERGRAIATVATTRRATLQSRDSIYVLIDAFTNPYKGPGPKGQHVEGERGLYLPMTPEEMNLGRPPNAWPVFATKRFIAIELERLETNLRTRGELLAIAGTLDAYDDMLNTRSLADAHNALENQLHETAQQRDAQKSAGVDLTLF